MSAAVASSPSTSNLNERAPMTVAIRVRPLLPKEEKIAEKENVPQPSCVSVDHQQATVVVEEKRLTVDLRPYVEVRGVFPMDYTFDTNSRNIHVYMQCVRNQLLHAIKNHERLACFAFGMTSSGKTHTTQGNGAEHGLYSLAVRDILQRGKGMDLYFSFYEIYGGKTFDLLNERAALLALEDDKQMVHLKGLSEFHIEDEDTFLELMQQGSTARSTGSTHANDRSSRSHAVALFNLTKKTSKGTIKVMSRFTFIDLAGSERGRDTLNTQNERHQEGAAINRSLLAVKECVRALHSGNQHVPFRGSKLTQVLRESLSGKCATVMIAMISPFYKHVEDTVNTLKYTNMLRQAAGTTTNSGSTSPQTNQGLQSGNGGKEHLTATNNTNASSTLLSTNNSGQSTTTGGNLSPNSNHNNQSQLLSSGNLNQYEDIECCTKCGYPIYDDDPTAHQCPKASMRCPHCQMGVMKRHLETHLTECPEVIVPCKFCNKEMKRKVLAQHENQECPKSFAVCMQCQQRVFPKGDLQTHMTETCLAAKWMCPFCKIVTSKRNAEEHQSTCAARLVTCENCGFRVRFGHMKQHKRICVGTRRLDEIMEQEVHSPKMLDPISQNNSGNGGGGGGDAAVAATPPSVAVKKNGSGKSTYYSFNRVPSPGARRGQSPSPQNSSNERQSRQQQHKQQGKNNNNNKNNSNVGNTSTTSHPALAHLRVPTHPALTAMIENQQRITTSNMKNMKNRNFAAPQSLTPPLTDGHGTSSSPKNNNSNNSNNKNNKNKQSSPQTSRVSYTFNRNQIQQQRSSGSPTNLTARTNTSLQRNSSSPSSSPLMMNNRNNNNQKHNKHNNNNILAKRSESPILSPQQRTSSLYSDVMMMNTPLHQQHHTQQTPTQFNDTQPRFTPSSFHHNPLAVAQNSNQQNSGNSGNTLLLPPYENSNNSNNNEPPRMSPMQVGACEFCGGRFLENVLQQHIENDCMMVQVRCPFADAGCNHLVERRNLATHLNENVGQHLVLLHSKTRNVEAENLELKQRLASLESTSKSQPSSLVGTNASEASQKAMMSSANIAAALQHMRRSSTTAVVVPDKTNDSSNNNDNNDDGDEAPHSVLTQKPSEASFNTGKGKMIKLKTSKQQVVSASSPQSMTVVKRKPNPHQQQQSISSTCNSSSRQTTGTTVNNSSTLKSPQRLNSTQRNPDDKINNNPRDFEEDSFRKSSAASSSALNDDDDDDYNDYSHSITSELGVERKTTSSPAPMKLDELLSGGNSGRDDDDDDDDDDDTSSSVEESRRRASIRKDEKDLAKSEAFLKQNQQFVSSSAAASTPPRTIPPPPRMQVAPAEEVDEDIVGSANASKNSYVLNHNQNHRGSSITTTTSRKSPFNNNSDNNNNNEDEKFDHYRRQSNSGRTSTYLHRKPSLSKMPNEMTRLPPELPPTSSSSSSPAQLRAPSSLSSSPANNVVVRKGSQTVARVPPHVPPTGRKGTTTTTTTTTTSGRKMSHVPMKNPSRFRM